MLAQPRREGQPCSDLMYCNKVGCYERWLILLSVEQVFRQSVALPSHWFS